MTAEEVIGLIAQGESQRLEFKSSFGEQNKAIETLCAFANSEGGKVFLGITDDGSIVGLQGRIGKRTLEHFANSIRIHTDPPITPIIDKIKAKGKIVYFASVPPHKRGELFFAGLGIFRGLQS